MKTVHDFAGAVAAHLKTKKGAIPAEFDPTIITTVADIVLQLIKMYQDNCHKQNGPAADGKASELVMRVMARRFAGPSLRKNGIPFRYGQKVADAIVDQFKLTDAHVVDAVVASAK